MVEDYRWQYHINQKLHIWSKQINQKYQI